MWLCGPFRSGIKPPPYHLELTDTEYYFAVQKSIGRPVLVRPELMESVKQNT